MIRRKLERKTDRKDFVSYIFNEEPVDSITHVQLAGHASDFVLAGSETAANALACIIYHLCKSPEMMRVLQAEIQGQFQSSDEIDARSTAGLRYLKLFIQEGLMMYPPLLMALARVVPRGGGTVAGEYLPEGVSEVPHRFGSFAGSK